MVSMMPLRFIKSYLKKQVVCKKLLLLGRRCCDPRGSTLGPLLFLIGILNDLPLAVRQKIILYADDSLFVNTSKSIVNCEILVIKTLDGASTDGLISMDFILIRTVALT